MGGGGGELFSSSCAVVREVHGGSEMFVFVLLAEFFCVWAFSQFLGAPRECISTDGGFNWSVGFQKKKKEKKKRKKSGLYAVFVAGYFNLFVCLVCFCLLMCCCFVFFFPEG